MPTNQEQVHLKPIFWRKTAGTFLLRRRDGIQEVISSGQVFRALPEEIPLTFRDTIKPVDPAELETIVNLPLETVALGYKIVPRGKLPGRFNIVDGQGKVQNERPLTADEADTILVSLGSRV